MSQLSDHFERLSQIDARQDEALRQLEQLERQLDRILAGCAQMPTRFAAEALARTVEAA